MAILTRPRSAWETSDNYQRDDMKGGKKYVISSTFYNEFTLWLSRKLVPIVLLVIFSLIGAGIFYALEMQEEDNIDICGRKRESASPYSDALYFVNTIHTTIGYGNIVPCTTGGKVFTCMYALFGMPIFVIALTNLGQILALLVTTIFVKMKKCCCKKSVGAVGVKPTLPILVGFTMTMVWMFIASGYFYALEDTVGYMDWFYFMFISVTTIGFGDYYPVDYDLTAIHFLFIMIGLALFSMMINVVQDKLENMSVIVAHHIAADYADALARGEVTMSEDPKIAKEQVLQRLRSQPGGRILEKLMSEKDKALLVGDYQSKAKMRVVETQTEILTVDFDVMCQMPSGDDISVQTQKSIPPTARW